MNKGLVSVIVITYNSCSTVLDTLESIKRQTYQNIELIVSDDCSCDNTVTVVKKWLKRNNKFFYNVKLLVARNNHGVVKNCNIGVVHASGEYIQIIAGDDVLLDNAIEIKYNYAKQNDLELVVSKVHISGTNEKTVKSMTAFAEKGYRIMQSGLGAQRYAVVESNFLVGPSGSFYRKDFFVAQGMYDIRFPMIEDHPFIYKYLIEGHEIKLLDKELAEYRLGDNSLSTSCKNFKYIESYLAFFLFVRFSELVRQKRIIDIIRSLITLSCYLLGYFKRLIKKLKR